MVKTKVYAGISLIVLLGVALMLYVYRGLDDVAGHLARLEEVDAPFSIAAIEMEKNAGEYALGVLRYVAYPLPEIREETENDSVDFLKYHATYMRLSTSERGRELGRHLAADFQELTTVGRALMDKRDAVDITFQRVAGYLEDIDDVIDHQMEPAAPDLEPIRSQTLAATANMEAEAAEIGFWLAAFIRRPTALARQRLQEKVVELEEALAGYRSLKLAPELRNMGDTVAAHLVKVKDGIDELLAGEDAIGEMLKDVVRLQTHIDDVSDEQVEPLAAKGLTERQEQADRTAVRVLKTLRYALPLYALVALSVGALLILVFLRPLGRLARGTRAIGEGNLDYRIPERGKDEFGDVARQFNRMVERLQESTVSKGLLEDSERKLRHTVAELRQEIAERQLSEQARDKLQAELRRSEAMAAMGSLVAGVAHEVRNPLFGITSTLDAMEANAATGAAANRYRPVLRREVNRLNKLMTDLLEYGRPPSNGFSNIRLSRIIGEAVHVCGPSAAAAGVTIDNRTVDCKSTLALVRGRLVQVFVNLIENAIQHAPRGSEIIVEAREVTGREGKPWMACCVKDSGPGLASDTLANVFVPFFTRRRNGTGLGLAIVQRIVDEHKGVVEAGNRPEGGAILSVYLPLEPDLSSSSAEAHAAPPMDAGD